MEVAGKYMGIDTSLPASAGLGQGINMSNQQLEQAITSLIKVGYTFEDAMAKLMAGVDLRGLRK
jgi:hypothetical protein